MAAPEIYHRHERPGTVMPYDDIGRIWGNDGAKRTPVAAYDADARATLDFLAKHPKVAPGKLATMGFCIGGHLAFRAAFDPRVTATVCFYPTGLHNGALGADADAGPLARAVDVHGRLMLVFGSRDPHVPAPARLQVLSALYAVGREDVEVHVYEGGEHAFMRDVGPRHDPVLTDLALTGAVAFLHRR